jgi:branched-chain amino acid transport system substrate-binding protein
VPWANGFIDYLKLVNAKGGINGVKISFEECETGYATDRGVECYERMKGKNGGATMFQPLSTGITFALTEKAPVDKIPIITAGYGRSESQNGAVFGWNFPLIGTYWMGADVLVQHIAKKEGGFDKLKGKKITLVYHDSPYGKEPIALLQERAKMHGFDLALLPVAHPGVEQKATWLQIRQNKPDYVFLWGWGVMNSTALKEAQATGFPREKMYGVWWAGAEPDVKDVGEGAKGYNALAMQHGAEPNAKVVKDVLAQVHGKGQGTGPKEEVGQVLYMRGLILDAVRRGVRKAQERYGKGKVMTGEQMRWGLENINLDQKTLDGMGFGRRDASGADLLPRPHGFGLGARAHLGWQEVELHFRLVPGRREGAASAGDADLGQVCGREEDQAAYAGRLQEVSKANGNIKDARGVCRPAFSSSQG